MANVEKFKVQIDKEKFLNVLKKHGLTQKKLAEAIERSPRTIYRIVKYEEMDLGIAQVIANVINEDISYIFIKDNKFENSIKSLKYLAIEECNKIPSNDKILAESFDIVHETTSKIIVRNITNRIIDGNDFEEHIITISWTQRKESEEKHG